MGEKRIMANQMEKYIKHEWTLGYIGVYLE